LRLPAAESQLEPTGDLHQRAYALIMGRHCYEAMAAHFAPRGTATEIDQLRRGDDGHIVVCGDLSFGQSLMRLDLTGYFYLSLYPYAAGEGRRLFDDIRKYGPLDLVSSTTLSNGPSSWSTGGTASAVAGKLAGRQHKPDAPAQDVSADCDRQLLARGQPGQVAAQGSSRRRCGPSRTPPACR
jgi:dihydrofolate reductase